MFLAGQRRERISRESSVSTEFPDQVLTCFISLWRGIPLMLVQRQPRVCTWKASSGSEAPMTHLSLKWPLLPFLCGPTTSCSAVDPGEHSLEHFSDEASETCNDVHSLCLIPCRCSPNLCPDLGVYRVGGTDSSLMVFWGGKERHKTKQAGTNPKPRI